MSALARLAGAALAAALWGAVPAAGQRMPQPRFAVASYVAPRLARSDSSGDVPVARVAGGAVIGGIVGTGVGALVGYLAGTTSDACDGSCDVYGALAGIIVGEPIGMGVGANAANSGRGLVMVDMLAAAGTEYLAILAAAQARSPGIVLLAVPVQVGIAAAFERATTRLTR